VSQKVLPKDDEKPIPQADDSIAKNAVTVNERWYYPLDIADDLKDDDLPPRVNEEVLACAWEYTRCFVPEYTNWARYVAFMRIIVIGTIAEFRGSLMDAANDDNTVGYKLTEVLKTLCGGTAGEYVFFSIRSVLQRFSADTSL